ncbi:proliferation marker protein Ki-67 isoform X2 [Microcebus murinus]|uniref:proliferation marker protein Ki-67 isoform X2 n=1 Tax=Microcebus murinus TaxID=30608 RepID=UPI003F6A9C4A
MLPRETSIMGIECDIRIQLPVVSKQHCKIETNEQEAILYNFSSTNPTQVNGSVIDKPVQLKHGDVITIIDRSFRYENESCQNGNKSTEFPGKIPEQGPSRRVSRSSFSSDPNGEDQDLKAHPKVTAENVSGRPQVHVKSVRRDSSTSGGSKGNVAQETPNVHSSEHPEHNDRNASDHTSGDVKENARVQLVSYHGELKSFSSTQCLDGSKKNDSPFRELYRSMKEELKVKSQKENVLQCHRKSRSQTDYTTEKESAYDLQRETQLLVSVQPREKSGRNTSSKAAPASPELDSGQKEGKGSDTESVPTSKEAVGSSIPFSDTTKMKTLRRYSQQLNSSQKHKSEDLYVLSGRTSVNLGNFKADDKTLTPRKLLTRTQTPTKVEDAANSAGKPGNLSSKNRRSVPTNARVLPTQTEIQNEPLLTLWLTEVERKIQKDSLHKPEKLGITAGQICSGLPGLSSVDISNFGDSINKSEGRPLKRRRVSFGGRLRPELFDENLPPNTPLKRGETPTKRKSLVAHTPTVLKKIIKEQPQASGKEESASEIHVETMAQNVFVRSPASSPRTTPVASAQSRRSCRESSASGGSKSQTDIPKRGGRKSGNLPSKRTSISRSQHGILQMICSKRRSGASEANLIVAKSWADVVKLGVKQTQTKVVKHGPQRLKNKKQRRPKTPKKPVDDVHNQFSTGHANSPCTIIIGKAHTEKVKVPAQPYRMLNNFISNQKLDFKEDLSGLSEMFKTPLKEKSQLMSSSPVTLSSSENLLGKKFQVTNSGEKPMLPTSESFGENVLFCTRNGAKEPDTHSASPALQWRCVKENETLVKTPRNIYKATPVKMKTSDTETEPSKTVSGANRLRRSTELRNLQKLPIESTNEETKTGTVEDIMGKCLRRPPLREKKIEGEMKETERPFETRKEIIESKENSEMMAAGRGSRRSWGHKNEPASNPAGLKRWPKTASMKDMTDTQDLQTPDLTKEPRNEKDKTTKLYQTSLQAEPVNTPTSMNRQLRTSLGKVNVKEELSALGRLSQTPGPTVNTHKEPVPRGTPQQKVDPENSVTGVKRWPRAAKEEVHPLEGLSSFKELFQTPKHSKKPTIEDKTPKIHSKSLQSEPVNIPSTKRWPKTSLGKIATEEELAALRKLSETPGESTYTPNVPAEDKDIKAFKDSAEQKLDPAASVVSSRTRPRAAKKESQTLEDLSGFKELFQTPNHNGNGTTDNKPTNISSTSPQPEPTNAPIGTKRRPKTSLGKMNVEELSASRKLSQTPGEATHTLKVPGEDKGIIAFKETAEQKLGLASSVTGSRKRPRAAEKEAQPLEDLAGFKELFQTPGHTEESMTDGKTTRLPCTSPGPGLVATPVSMKTQPNTSLRKADVEGEFLVLRKLTPSSGKAMHTPKPPVDGEKGIRAFMGTPKQRHDLAEDSTGHKRRPRTPKEEAQSLEDLSGFKELFQTPGHTDKTMTVDKSTKVLWKSLQPAATNTPMSTSRQLRISLGKVDVKEELSAVGRLPQTPGQTVHTHKEPVPRGKGTKMLQETPRQNVDPENSVTGVKRWPRAAKEEVHPLEDLSGFKELFQTPKRNDRPTTEGKTARISSKSPQPEPVNTPIGTKRRPKTPLGKMGTEEELAPLRKLSQTPGKSTHPPKVPAENKDVRVFMESVEQKLDPVGSVVSSRKRPRAPKEDTKPLEDLSGFKELFQTPKQNGNATTEDKTTKIPGKYPQPELVSTSTSMKRRPKTPLGKTAIEEDLSALRKLSQTPGESMHTPKETLEHKGIIAFRRSAEQKLYPAASVTGSKKRPRAAEEEAHPLEDLSGFKELFQTPRHSKKATTEDKTTKIPCTSLQAERVNTPICTKRWPKTPLGKMTVEEEPSASRKLLQTPGKPTHTSKVPGEDKSIRVFKETAEQKLGLAASISSSRRKSRAAEKETQPLEDLAGFKELFQTPGHTEESMTDGKTTRPPCTSPGPGLVATPVSMKTQPNTSLRKADVEGEFLVLRKLTPSSGKAMHTPKPPVDGEKGIRAFMGTPKQRHDLAEDSTGHKRRPRTPKEEAQSLEDLSGFKELFQTPGHTDKTMTVDKSTKVLWKSLQPAATNTPMSTSRQLRISLGKVDVKEELSAVGRLPQTPGQTVHTHKEPVPRGKGTKMLQETPRQNVDPENSVTGVKRWPRAAKEEVHPLEDLSGFKELFQTPKRNDRPTTQDKAAKIPCRSPQPEPANTPIGTKRQPKTSLGKMNVEEELAAPRKPSQTPGEPRNTLKVPVEDKDIIAFKQSAEQKLGLASSVTGSRRRPSAAEKETRSLEDLAGFKELFQTPGHTEESMTDGKTTRPPCTSPGPGLVATPVSMKTQPNTSLRKADVEGEFLVLRKLTPSSGKAMHTPKPPVDGEKGIRAFMGTPKQRHDLAEDSTGHKRRPRTPKEEAQSLEDLSGFKELFQTPGHTDKTMTVDKSTKVLWKSLQPAATNTPMSTSRQLRISLGKVDVKEELSAVGRLPQTPGQTVHTHKEPVPRGKGTKMLQETPRQNVDPENSVTGVKRWPRAAKEEVHPLEDLSGFKELFQTPKRNDRPTTQDKTTRISSKAPQPEPVNTPTSMKRWPKTPLGKTGTEEELAALRLSQTPGEATDTRKVLGDDKGIRAFKESAEQKLDPAASVPGSRKRPRAAKKEAQPLEDLSGLKELFQTPKHNDKPTTEDKTTKIPSKSLQLEPGNTLLATKRRPNRHLGKISTEEELSALRKLSQLPGESTHLPKLPGEVKGIKVFKESAEQKLDPVASVRGSSRRLRAAKGEAQPLEELSHFKKPFQTPGHTEETLTVDKRTKVSCTTLQPEPLDTAISTRRRPKANLRNVSALGKLTETSGESTHMHEVPVGNHKGIKAFKESAEPKLDQAASITGSRRRPRAAKEKAQPLEDLAGFKKPFPIPSHTEESMTVDKSTKMSCNSPQPEPVDTVVSTRWPKRSLRKVSAMMKVTQASGESTHAHEILVVKDKGINVFKQSAEQKLDLAANITDSRRRPRATKENAQPLEVLAGFKKPFPAPGHTEESTTSAKTATSPLPEPVDTTASRKRQPKGSLRKVSVLQNLMQTSGETTHTSTEPQGRGKRIRVAKESAKQKLDPAENVYGTKRQPSTAKKEAEALEVLANFKELVPAPGQPGEPRKDAESLKTTPKQPPDSGESLKTFRRVLRAPKAQSMEDMVGTRDPIKSQSKSNTALTSKRKCGKDDCVLGTKRLRCMTATEGVVEEEPANKKQRTVPREKHSPTELLVVMKKSLRTSAESMEPVGDLNSNNMKTKKKEHEAEGSVTANKGISLRPRRQNKSDVEQQKTEVPIAAEKTKIKRNEKKSVKTSQELETENPGDRAKEPTARGKVSESRSCSRSLRQSKSSQPIAAQEEGAKQGVGTHTQNQREKGVRGNSDFMRLRSRKVQIQPAVNMLGSEPEQRATRAMKRRAENPKEGKDIVFIKKMRTRSHRDSEDI